MRGKRWHGGLVNTSGPGMCLMGRFFSSKPIAISIMPFMLTISDEPRFSGCTHARSVRLAHDRVVISQQNTLRWPRVQLQLITGSLWLKVACKKDRPCHFAWVAMVWVYVNTRNKQGLWCASSM